MRLKLELMEGTANNIDLRPRVKACDLISE